MKTKRFSAFDVILITAFLLFIILTGLWKIVALIVFILFICWMMSEGD